MCHLLMALAMMNATPNEQHRKALLDLTEIAKADPVAAQRTRYIDLTDVPEDSRSKMVRVVEFVVNSTSWRSSVGIPVALGGDLLRIRLDSFGWDKEFRRDRLESLARLGVRFADSNRLIDIWEVFANGQPHFKAPQNYHGKYYRGWIDPQHDCAARTLSGSASFIVRGAWLVPRIMLERELGGFYSETLLLPDAESELYKLLSVDIGRFDKEDGFRRGLFLVNGTDSYVALHNRELQLIKTPIGQETGFLWRTFDVADDSKSAKRVLNALAGDLRLDGREIIFSLPNGLHGYRLSNGKGDRVAEVPPNIAQDKRSRPVGERRVLTAYKCVDCHGEQDGLLSGGDQARKLLVGDSALGFVVKNYDSYQAERRKREVEEYYLNPLEPVMVQQRESYAKHLKEVNGLSGAENAANLVSAVEHYLYSPVDLAQAERETGIEHRCLEAFLASVQGESSVLSRGNAIPRPAFDDIFDDVMLGVRYPWDHQ